MNETESTPFNPKEILLEKIAISETEAVLQGKPFVFDSRDAENLRSIARVEGLNTELTEEERRSLLEGTQLRLKPKVEGEMRGLLIYVSELGGERWVELTSLEELPPKYYVRKNEESGKEIIDRSLGLIAVLGVEKTSRLISECQELASGAGWGRIVTIIKDPETREIIKTIPRDETEGRGLQQAVADVISIAVLDQKSPDFESELRKISDRLNRRLWKGLRRIWKKQGDEIMLKGVDEKFGALGIEEPTKKLSSYSPLYLRTVLGSILNYDLQVK